MKEYVFLKDKYSKVIFNDNECRDYLIALLSKILGVDETTFENNFEIKSTEIEYDRSTKRSIADALYETDDDIINVEINLNKSEILERKNHRYICQLISKQVKIGDKENNFKKVIQINLNNYDFLKKGEFIYKSIMMEEKYHIKTNDFMTIYNISLDYLKLKEYNKIQEEDEHSLERLLYIFVCDNPEKRLKLYKGDALMEKINEKLIGLSGVDMSDLYYSEEEYKEYKKAVFSDVAFHKGIEQRNKEVAESMLKENLDVELIIKITGLTKEEINNLKENK